MGQVAEQRPDEQRPPERPSGSAPEPARESPARESSGDPAQPGQSLAPGGQNSPEQLDPEQLRQFQQFQQFQDFLRFSEAQRTGGGMVPGQAAPGQTQPPAQTDQQQPWLPAEPPPPGSPPQVRPDYLPEPRPRPKVPRWLRKLGGKVLGILILVVLLGIAGKLAYNHFFPEPNTDLPASQTGGGTYHTNHILPTASPYEAVRSVYDAIAQGLVPQACGRFDESIQQQFGRDLGFADCQQAVPALNREVTNKNDYAESMPSNISEPLPGDVVQVSSCAFGIKGGRPLGAFTVKRVEKGQWLIVGHSNETCAPVPSSSGGPTR
jgi:hypothetical protein